MTVESDVQAFLVANSFANVYMGPARPPLPPEMPDAAIFVLQTGGQAPSPYMNGTRVPYRYMRCQIRIRGEANSYASTQFRANSLWSLLQQSSSTMTGSYVRLTCDQSQPMYMGLDAQQHPEFIVNITAEKIT